MDDNKIRRIIYSSYLALGSIALYLCVSYIGTICANYLAESSNKGIGPVDPFNATGYWIGFIISLIAGILLILSYRGFMHSRKYPRFTGIIGCVTLVLGFSYVVCKFISVYGGIYLEATAVSIAANLGGISLSIASVILLVITLIFWKKLTL
jgi:hypothetical protein